MVILVRMVESTSMSVLIFRLTARALLDPRVAVDLLSMAWAFRRRDWWRQSPFLPLPDATYLRWRMHTAYGEEQALPSVEEVLRFAHWRRRILRG